MYKIIKQSHFKDLVDAVDFSLVERLRAAAETIWNWHYGGAHLRPFGPLPSILKSRLVYGLPTYCR